MRLRYLRVRHLPPLEDVTVLFGHEPALGRECAIHFIVGVNGSGKSRMLQTLADALLHLEMRRLPSYPITLAYDLETGTDARTIYLRHPGGSAENGVFIHSERVPLHARWDGLEDVDWADSTKHPFRVIGQFKGNELPGEGSIGYYLPSVMLAYTSGATASWEEIFSPQRADREGAINIISNVLTDAGGVNVQERPPNWNSLKEAQLLGQEGFQQLSEESVSGQPQTLTTRSLGLFVSPNSLRLALAAVALDQAVREFRDEMPTEQAEKSFIERINESLEEGKRMPGLRGVLNEVDWLWPVTIGLRLSFQANRLTRRRREELRLLYGVATSVLRDPEIQEPDAEAPALDVATEQARTSGRPGEAGQSRETERTRGRQLFFDLRRPLPDRESKDNSTAAALMEALSPNKNNVTPLGVFTQLRIWQQEGLLEDVLITLRKRNVEDLLPYDWLSDGERVFLGRMALFHLLRGDNDKAKGDALILLDEPETHFNDLWKREIVDIIDDSLGDVASDVVITTHSSIALTDVFDNEITLMTKSASDGQIKASRSPVRSFGASPTEIMRDIFGAPEGVGQRAAKFLDMVLAAAASPEQLEEIWKLDGDEQAVKNSEAFGRLRELVLESADDMEHDYGTDEQLDQRLLKMLYSLKGYAQEGEGAEQSTVAGALDSLENRLGAGYYQFEFRRRLRGLRGGDPNAS